MSENQKTHGRLHRALHLEDPWACYEDEDAVCGTTQEHGAAQTVAEDDDCCCCCCG
ncbi:MAG: hypothetical protein QNJ22_19720 [Desulfosarcinaceae bacterium]|nr:hypothetical protein [Desulfosarcinaceae bacterium]